MSITSLVGAGRRLARGTFLDEVMVLDHELTPDGQGGVLEEWAPRDSTTDRVRGRFGPLTEGDERGRIVRNVAGQTESAPQGAFTCPLGTDLGENDYIVDVATGRSWKVLGETTPPSATAVQRRLLIRED